LRGFLKGGDATPGDEKRREGRAQRVPTSGFSRFQGKRPCLICFRGEGGEVFARRREGPEKGGGRKHAVRLGVLFDFRKGYDYCTSILMGEGGGILLMILWMGLRKGDGRRGTARMPARANFAGVD